MKQNILITGASRGLGAALARTLARLGHSILLVARQPQELEAVVGQIREHGGRAFAYAADIADKTAIHPLAAYANDTLGSVDVLINNASTLGPLPMPYLLDTACEDLSAVLEANTLGAFRLTQALAGHMVVEDRGTIIGLSSDAAVDAYPAWGSYGVSKAAFDHLLRILGVELAQTAVRVLSIDPGEMDTAMHRAAMPSADPSTLRAPERVAEAIARIMAEPKRAPFERLQVEL